MPSCERECGACTKVYSSTYNLNKHLQRQPLCAEWMRLSPGISTYIDDKFMLPMSDREQRDASIKCFICGTTFANTGNLNRHLDCSVVCSKWAMYKDLKPLESYIASGPKPALIASGAAEEEAPFEPQSAPFEPPKPGAPMHIIWNVYLTDKDSELTRDVIRENDIRFVLAILPDAAIYAERVKVDVEHCVMVYEGHRPALSRGELDAFDEQCRRIEGLRGERANVLVFCNNGYQRSLPFLCYFLIRYHASEAPTVERAMDLILPYVDRAGYPAVRGGMIAGVEALFRGVDLSPVLLPRSPAVQ